MVKENEDLITPRDSLDLEKKLKALEDVQVPACSPVLNQRAELTPPSVTLSWPLSAAFCCLDSLSLNIFLSRLELPEGRWTLSCVSHRAHTGTFVEGQEVFAELMELIWMAECR